MQICKLNYSKTCIYKLKNKLDRVFTYMCWVHVCKHVYESIDLSGPKQERRILGSNNYTRIQLLFVIFTGMGMGCV